MMPNAMEAAMKEMCSDAIAQAVEVLAAKYDFDVDEAARALEGVKIVRKRGPSPKTVASGGKAKAKKASDGDKPKRAKTGYLLYSDFIRATVRSELEQLRRGFEVKLRPQDVVKEIAARWKSELPSEKEAWNAAAKAGLPGPGDSGKAGRQEARVAEVAAEELNLSDEDDSDDDDDDEEDDE